MASVETSPPFHQSATVRSDGVIHGVHDHAPALSVPSPHGIGRGERLKRVDGLRRDIASLPPIRHRQIGRRHSRRTRSRAGLERAIAARYRARRTPETGGWPPSRHRLPSTNPPPSDRTASFTAYTITRRP